MKKVEFIKTIIEISEKFNSCDPFETKSLYFETLHSSLLLILKDFTEEEFNNLQEPVRRTFEQLEQDVFKWTSPQYKELVKKSESEVGRFYNKKPKTSERQFKIAGFCKELTTDNTEKGASV